MIQMVFRPFTEPNNLSTLAIDARPRSPNPTADLLIPAHLSFLILTFALTTQNKNEHTPLNHLSLNHILGLDSVLVVHDLVCLVMLLHLLGRDVLVERHWKRGIGHQLKVLGDYRLV